MKVRVLIVLGVLLLASSLYAQQDFSQLYYSDRLSMVELITPSSGAAEVMYFQNFESDYVSQPLQSWYGSDVWKYVTVPSPRYIGFRNLDEDIINPIFSPVPVTPALDYYTPLVTDPTGDAAFTNAWLDLTEVKVTFTVDRLFFAIKNNHTSFPVSSGLTYFAYMPILVNPYANPEDNPPVFGLMHTVSIPGIIGPGLYKVTGTGFSDLARIGNIEQSVFGNTLILSCALSDLIADPDFSSWYDPDYPLAASMVTTSRITLTGGTQSADQTDAVKLLLKPRYAWPVDDFLPQLSNAGYEISGYPVASMVASVVCTDLDNNFPSYAWMELDNVPYLLHPVFPDALDFSTGITWQSDPVTVSGTWIQLSFIFSYGESSTMLTIENPSSHEDLVQVAIPSLTIYPNPVRDNLVVKTDGSQEQTLHIFNIKGQLLQTHAIAAGKTEQSLSVAGLASGVYLVKTSSGQRYRMLKL